MGVIHRTGVRLGIVKGRRLSWLLSVMCMTIVYNGQRAQTATLRRRNPFEQASGQSTLCAITAEWAVNPDVGGGKLRDERTHGGERS